MHQNIITGEKMYGKYNSGSSYSSYKNSAKIRGKSFCISEEEYNNIVSQNCYLCGKEGRNGIDRYDNKIGYLTENIRPCCKICNYMKSSMDINIFILSIKNIYDFYINGYDTYDFIDELDYEVIENKDELYLEDIPSE